MRFYRVFYSFVLLHWIFISGTVECVSTMTVLCELFLMYDSMAIILIAKQGNLKMLQLFTYYTLPHVVHDVSDEKD